METNFSYRCGIIGGMLLSILPNITMADLYKTGVLAAVGATISYLVSYLLNKVFKK